MEDVGKNQDSTQSWPSAQTNQCREKHLYKSCDQEHNEPSGWDPGIQCAERTSACHQSQLYSRAQTEVLPHEQTPLNKHIVYIWVLQTDVKRIQISIMYGGNQATDPLLSIIITVLRHGGGANMAVPCCVGCFSAGGTPAFLCLNIHVNAIFSFWKQISKYLSFFGICI